MFSFILSILISLFALILLVAYGGFFLVVIGVAMIITIISLVIEGIKSLFK